jgi:hypothetical protein
MGKTAYGYDYKDPEDVALDDWLIVEFMPLGASETMRIAKLAFRVQTTVRVNTPVGWMYMFSLAGFPDSLYTVHETAMVPINHGPC